jgi:hypothetical protein
VVPKLSLGNGLQRPSVVRALRTRQIAAVRAPSTRAARACLRLCMQGCNISVRAPRYTIEEVRSPIA